MEELLKRYPALKSCADEIEKTAEILISGFKAGNKLLLCGNGGSCADCEHITGELMKGFLSRRPLTPRKKGGNAAAQPRAWRGCTLKITACRSRNTASVTYGA